MKQSILPLLLVLVLIFASCGTAQEANSITSATSENAQMFDANNSTSLPDEDSAGAQAQAAVSFTDALGREITVSSANRVVTLLGSFCDEWLLSGGMVVGTASDSFTSFELNLDSDVVDIGSHMEPDVEKILALSPDLVIASSMLDGQLQLMDTLEKAGITVAYFYVNSFEDYLSVLSIFTEITGRPELFELYGTNVGSEIEVAKAQIDGRQPTVLFIRAAASSVKVKGSEGTVGGEILADLDTINIADSQSLLEDLSMEAIIQADPDYIFVTTQGSDTEAALANVEELMISNPAWESLTAVQNGNYYVLDKALYNSKPNARWGEAYQYLADILYPVDAP